MASPTFETPDFQLQLDVISDDPDFNLKMNDGFKFISLDVLETVNSLPYFVLSLSFSKEILEDIYKIRNFRLTYTSKNPKSELKYAVVLGVNKLEFDRRNLSASYKGWACNNTKFINPKTRYLGNGAKTALEELGLFDAAGFKSLVLEDTAFDFFQINETDLSAYLKICDYSATTPYWFISRTGTFLTPSETTAADYGLDPTTFDITPQKWVYNPGGSYEDWKSNGCDLSYKTRKSQTYGKLSALGTPGGIHAFPSDAMMRDKFADRAAFWSSGLLWYGTQNYLGEYPLPLGTVVDKTSYAVPGIKRWIVGSCYYHYSSSVPKAVVMTSVQYIGLQESVYAK